MHTKYALERMMAVVAGVAILAFSGWASADPPSRIARLGFTAGAVSFSPAGEDDWVQATINRPLSTGDRLWSDSRSRAEVQVSGAMIRMNANTGVSVLNLDDRITQLQLTQGILTVRVRHLAPDQVFEVDTPNLAFVLSRPGEFRIEVDPDGDATTIAVRRGEGEAYGESASYVIDSRQPYRFTGVDLREYQAFDAPGLDEFDRWGRDRDRELDNSRSARYVSQDMVGYQDLDANGTWRNDAAYGSVWVPNRVPAGWAPYRDGHWAWVDPWGWTWVDDAPWGFAVSHYGRWANFSGTWGWVPGPVQSRAYYAPALVVFVGGANFQLTISGGSVGGVAWFPLAPREVYRPSYAVSRRYFENVNQSNTVINNTVINNVYNSVNVTNIVYANRQVPGAVVAVPTTAFVQSQPVSRAAVRVSQEAIVSRAVVAAPPVAPTENSVRGAATKGDKPPARVFDRPVVARTAPPAAHVGFAAQQQQLTEKPGTPLDDAARRRLKPEAVTPAPVVKIVQPTPTAPRAVAPPPTKATTPQPPEAVPPATTAKPETERGDPGERGKVERREPPDATPKAPQQRTVPPRVAPLPPAAASAPVARQPPQRGQPVPASVPRQADRLPAATAVEPAPPPPTPRAAQRAKAPGPAASEPSDKVRDRGEQKREDEDRRQKR